MPVVVLDVLCQDRLHVALANDPQPVQALAADAGGPPFAPRIGIGRPAPECG